MDLFSRRGFIATALASLAHFVVSKSAKPKSDPDGLVPGQRWTVTKKVGGSIEIADSVWYVGAPRIGDVPVYDPYTGSTAFMRDGLKISPIAHTLKNAKIEYVQQVSLVGPDRYCASPATIAGTVERYGVVHFPDGDQRCDLLTVRTPTPHVVVYPVTRDGLGDCDIHTVIRMTNVRFFSPAEEINNISWDGVPTVLFTADTVSYTTESKYVGAPELLGKDARKGD